MPAGRQYALSAHARLSLIQIFEIFAATALGTEATLLVVWRIATEEDKPTPAAAEPKIRMGTGENLDHTR